MESRGIVVNKIQLKHNVGGRMHMALTMLVACGQAVDLTRWNGFSEGGRCSYKLVKASEQVKGKWNRNNRESIVRKQYKALARTKRM
jgi:hypothetical protein